ncbi:MAG TPA: hypothetical protein VMU77_06140, partial [Acidimicrobiales bacterium]|nr:hypothetical protein [Acidimicrobiales bacterium]
MILFLAALPDPETAAQIGAAFSDEIPGVVLTPPEKLHVTLRYLGNTQIEPKVLVERLDAEFKALGKERIMIKLGPNPVWFNRTVLAIPAHGAEELKDCCDAACTSLEVGP